MPAGALCTGSWLTAALTCGLSGCLLPAACCLLQLSGSTAELATSLAGLTRLGLRCRLESAALAPEFLEGLSQVVGCHFHCRWCCSLRVLLLHVASVAWDGNSWVAH
jgi:hypothetical protein